MAVAVAGKVGKEGRSRARETEMEGGGQGWSKARWGRVEQSRRDGKSSATAVSAVASTLARWG
jgi:hypothetical protein